MVRAERAAPAAVRRGGRVADQDDLIGVEVRRVGARRPGRARRRRRRDQQRGTGKPRGPARVGHGVSGGIGPWTTRERAGAGEV